MSTAVVPNRVDVAPQRQVREVWETRTALFGLLRWDVLVSATEMDGRRLVVQADRVPPKVYVNGVEYRPITEPKETE